MILDSLENAAKYEVLHPSFKKAFDYLRQNDLKNLPVDFKHEIEGVKFFGYNGKGKTEEESLETFECHDKNIDIQFCISEAETFAWKPRAKCVLPNGGYNEEKDVRFFKDQPDTFFQYLNTLDNFGCLYNLENIHYYLDVLNPLLDCI